MSSRKRRKDPCKGCKNKNCSGTNCPRWRPDFLERWGGITGYAILHGVKPICPELTENPCDKCTNKSKCKQICPARAYWWDLFVGKFKKELGI